MVIEEYYKKVRGVVYHYWQTDDNIWHHRSTTLKEIPINNRQSQPKTTWQY